MSMGDMMKMLQQAQQMQERMKEQLAARTVTGSAGGGMVTVEADGTGQVRRVRIDPSVAGGDVEMLEDLIVVALADAQKRVAQVAQEEMGRLAGGLNLPFKLPF